MPKPKASRRTKQRQEDYQDSASENGSVSKSVSTRAGNQKMNKSTANSVPPQSSSSIVVGVQTQLQALENFDFTNPALWPRSG